MNELEFINQWKLDKPIYEAWGNYVVNSICYELEKMGKNSDTFLKIPSKCRLKEDSSLVDKAFYRPGKQYSDPYNQIEDKVGARFVVLLLEDIKEICEIVKGNSEWTFDECKHFEDDKKRDPLLFTYQSVHYILRPKDNLITHGINVPATTACELQVRTLLQHAHAELTHDAIYKTKKTVRPEVHRTVAKSMALIETTDEFFTSVTKQLNYGPLQEYGVIERLDGLYLSLTGIKSHLQKSSIVIWDEYEQFIDDKLFDNIQILLTNPKYSYLPDTIKNRYPENVFYQQSTILFIYWMLIYRKRRLLENWPFQRELLEPLAVDLGMSTWTD
ncbi:GTP pyrophosphokinase [Sulfurirhabdus autotrophica]|uniref:RelA/SpoT family protein n=1 Tax=Sulfurirhabdus autotrophica TaxID=1706046 RepID=A0A4R3XSQ5_9PROT|nr:RelA/SpoT domain-containing protein [Sulfurirhabdus autotrophica]TCV82685.1 RelA/SpoT family protein [Sulfurirhabdus autotrophica]